jgi:hypothetical protein
MGGSGVIFRRLETMGLNHFFVVVLAVVFGATESIEAFRGVDEREL